MQSTMVSSAYLWKLREKINSSRFRLFRKIYRRRYKRLLDRAGAYIPESVKFSDLPSFPHSVYGVFISQGAVIGKNCTIFHQVTIGSNTLLDSKHPGAPTILDDVYIGCGAKIIGGITVGSHVRIGANCVVTEDIPDDTVVVMQKPRVLPLSKERDNRFIAFQNISSLMKTKE